MICDFWHWIKYMSSHVVNVWISGAPADGSDIPAWVEQKGGTLHFTTVTRADAGNYTCLASNSLQGEIRAVVQLTVAGTGGKSGFLMGLRDPRGQETLLNCLSKLIHFCFHWKCPLTFLSLSISFLSTPILQFMWCLSSSRRIPQFIRDTPQYFTVRPLETLLPSSSGRKKTNF